MFLALEMIELNDFRKLLVHRILRPDTYPLKLHEYVNKMLDITFIACDWETLFDSDDHNCIIINIDNNSDISISTKINKLYENIAFLAKKNETAVIVLNCDNLSAYEFNEEKSKIENGLLILKNVDLANGDVLLSIKATLQQLNGLLI